MKNTLKFKAILRIAGIIALVAVIGALTGCAYEKAMVKDTPKEQRASLYLAGKNNRIDKIDGKGVGFAMRAKKWTLYIRGDIVTDGGGKNRGAFIPDEVRAVAMQTAAGEHTLTMSASAFVGRKKYELTYNFEAGKRYLLDIRTDPSLSLAEGAAAALKGDYIVVVTDMDAPKKTLEINIDLSGGL
ncbi:MAG: hypothetical protein LBH43_01965 [Treponema sp.]|jgi:hypothetical protein|nr:hypothetical protein [Treponema sp.]